MEIEDLTYPVLMFRDGYVFRVQTVRELMVENRRTLEDTMSGDWRIADCAGQYGRVVAWNKIPRPPGLRSLVVQLFGTTFVKPVIVAEASKTLLQLIQNIEPMLIEHRMYGGGYGHDKQRYLRDLRNVSSFADLFSLIEDSV